jgi:hypothetical protein
MLAHATLVEIISTVASSAALLHGRPPAIASLSQTAQHMEGLGSLCKLPVCEKAMAMFYWLVIHPHSRRAADSEIIFHNRRTCS